MRAKVSQQTAMNMGREIPAWFVRVDGEFLCYDYSPDTPRKIAAEINANPERYTYWRRYFGLERKEARNQS